LRKVIKLLSKYFIEIEEMKEILDVDGQEIKKLEQ